MIIQSQNLKPKLLITGGSGDLAQTIANQLSERFTIFSPDSIELDVSSTSSVDNFFYNKSFDVVLNCAGTLYSSVIKDSVPELWVRDINVNLIGTYLVCRKAIQQNENVKLINISSTAAFNTYNDWTSYCASKSGVLSLSGGMFKDGYDVVTLCPGAIDTKLRGGLSIVNPNVMSIEEGVIPIISVLKGRYVPGDIIFYRKDELVVINHNTIDNCNQKMLRNKSDK